MAWDDLQFCVRTRFTPSRMIKYAVARAPVCDICANLLNDPCRVDTEDMGIVPQLISDRSDLKVDWIKSSGMDANQHLSGGRHWILHFT
jgi:hypothetical protein